MALAQHRSVQVRHQQQVDNAREFLIPFLEEAMELTHDVRIMEIGCGEGGVLIPFLERGHRVLGVDLNESRIRHAKELNHEAIEAGRAELVYQDVYEASFLDQYRGSFDLILLKDTIEHIPNQERFIPYIKQFLTEKGKIFFGFPPWRMPFGGHQQICNNKILGALPWYHLLPRAIYRGILRAAGENDRVVNELMDIKSTQISLNRFERIIRNSDLAIVHRRLFLLNPIYKFKFGWQPIEQARWLAAWPWIRDFFTTAGWYVVG